MPAWAPFSSDLASARLAPRAASPLSCCQTRDVMHQLCLHHARPLGFSDGLHGLESAAFSPIVLGE